MASADDFARPLASLVAAHAAVPSDSIHFSSCLSQAHAARLFLAKASTSRGASRTEVELCHAPVAVTMYPGFCAGCLGKSGRPRKDTAATRGCPKPEGPSSKRVCPELCKTEEGLPWSAMPSASASLAPQPRPGRLEAALQAACQTTPTEVAAAHFHHALKSRSWASPAKRPPLHDMAMVVTRTRPPKPACALCKPTQTDIREILCSFG